MKKPITVSVTEFKAAINHIMAQVYQGNTFHITVDGGVVAVLKPRKSK